MASIGKAQVEITLSDETRDVLERLIAAVEKASDCVTGEAIATALANELQRKRDLLAIEKVERAEGRL